MTRAMCNPSDYATVFRNAQPSLTLLRIRCASFRIWLRVTGGRV
ncbi:hypothetical protein VPH234P10_0095 [Vibrio phage 234P10]